MPNGTAANLDRGLDFIGQVLASSVIPTGLGSDLDEAWSDIAERSRLGFINVGLDNIPSRAVFGTGEIRGFVSPDAAATDTW